MFRELADTWSVRTLGKLREVMAGKAAGQTEAKVSSTLPDCLEVGESPGSFQAVQHWPKCASERFLWQLCEGRTEVE